MRYWAWLFLLQVELSNVQAQTLGGNAVFSFLQNPTSAKQLALGGVNISAKQNHLSLAIQNPALLQNSHQQQIASSFYQFLGGIQQFSFASAYAYKNNSTMATAIQYLNYGSILQTDASGNTIGSFRANDWMIQQSIQTKYRDHWSGGVNFKYIQSSYGQFVANALALDAGVAFSDEEQGIAMSLLVKNLGVQLKKYTSSSSNEELPFELQIGISKKLKHAPLQFSLTAHQLQHANIWYNDTSFLANEGITSFRNKNHFLNKVLSHLILSTQVMVRDEVEITAAYNFLRRYDLNVLANTNGLNGLSFGIDLKLNKFQMHYATALYQRNATHLMSLYFFWTRKRSFQTSDSN